METNLDNPVWVSNSSNLLNLQKNYQKDQKIQFECVNCGKTEIKRLRNFRKYKEKPFLCRKCRTIETNLKKYGVPVTSQAELVKRGVEQRNLEKYGCKYPMQKEEIKNRVIMALKESGNASFFGSEKYKEAMLRKYGVDNPDFIPGKMEQIIETKRKRYGQNLEKIVEKIKKTMIQNYGSLENCYKEIRKNQKKYFLKNFGVESYSQTEGFFKNFRKRYFFDNQYFDSKLEIVTYEFLKKNNFEFEMQKRFPKPYEVDNKKHYTFVDFYLRELNVWIECKGACFFNKEGEPVLPFGYKKEPEKQKQNEKKWRAKYQFLKENNVLIVKNKDDLPYILDHVVTYEKI